jgi:signal transduction histidine kinase
LQENIESIMNAIFATINAFIEDTCVLIVIAYVLARGETLTLLAYQRRDTWAMWRLGLILGAIGMTEAVFPGARFPYVTHTLITTFATLVGGVQVGLIVAGIVSLGTLLMRPHQIFVVTVLAVLGSLAAGWIMRRAAKQPYRPACGFGAGMLAQVFVTLLYALLPNTFGGRLSIPHAIISIPANGFGIVLLQLVLKDAEVRAASERNRIELERSRSVLAEMQMNALRARVHPHFLFNTLTSVASLCNIDPVKAEAAVVRLGQLMRRALDKDVKGTTSIEEEIECVQSYLWIEQERFGERLHVEYDIDKRCDSTLVPAFSVQILAENAVNHGLGLITEDGTIAIAVRPCRRGVLLSVRDNGAGMSPESRREALDATRRVHGLQMLNEQLRLLYGPMSRLRLFSRNDCGTLAAFVVPTTSGRSLNERKKRC